MTWIDLGCPIELDPHVTTASPSRKESNGYFADDQRPTLTLTYPEPGENRELSRILIGMFDYETGLDMDQFTVIASTPLDGIPAGTNLANRFTRLPDHRWEWKLPQPIKDLPETVLTVTIRDERGNRTEINREFSVGRR